MPFRSRTFATQFKVIWLAVLQRLSMIDVYVPTTDGRELSLTRYTQPESELKLLLDKLKLSLPAQAPPKIFSATHAATAALVYCRFPDVACDESITLTASHPANPPSWVSSCRRRPGNCLDEPRGLHQRDSLWRVGSCPPRSGHGGCSSCTPCSLRAGRRSPGPGHSPTSLLRSSPFGGLRTAVSTRPL